MGCCRNVWRIGALPCEIMISNATYDTEMKNKFVDKIYQSCEDVVKWKGRLETLLDFRGDSRKDLWTEVQRQRCCQTGVCIVNDPWICAIWHRILIARSFLFAESAKTRLLRFCTAKKSKACQNKMSRQSKNLESAQQALVKYSRVPNSGEFSINFYPRPPLVPVGQSRATRTNPAAYSAVLLVRCNSPSTPAQP